MTGNETNIINTTTSMYNRVSVIQIAAAKPYHANLSDHNETITCNLDENVDKDRFGKTDIGEMEEFNRDLGGIFEPEISCPDSELILKYIHKKFGKGKHKQNSKTEECLSLEQSSILDPGNR